MQPWVLQETRTAHFGDERIDRRYALLLDRLSDKPSLSIPAACSGCAGTAAAYRFFDNQRVCPERVLQPHHDATLERIRHEAVVLLPQDTTELDLTRPREKVGGPLNDDKGWGLFAHPLLALTPGRPGVRLPAVTVNAILVLEEDPPGGEGAIEWLLLTSLPVATFADVQTAIDYYCCRWEIEVYFRVLKGGCRVEQLQLEATERLEACLAMYLIVAWRVLYVLMLGRECPEMRCDAVLAEAEWKSVYQIVSNRKPPGKPPALGEMVEMIAELGGYLGRKHDGPPGPKVIWIGLQRMRDFALAWAVFRPDPEKDV